MIFWNRVLAVFAVSATHAYILVTFAFAVGMRAPSEGSTPEGIGAVIYNTASICLFVLVSPMVALNWILRVALPESVEIPGENVVLMIFNELIWGVVIVSVWVWLKGRKARKAAAKA